MCPGRLTIFIKSIKVSLLKDTGDQLLPQEVTHLGIYNDATGIPLFHYTFNEKRCKDISKLNLENLLIFKETEKSIAYRYIRLNPDNIYEFALGRRETLFSNSIFAGQFCHCCSA